MAENYLDNSFDTESIEPGIEQAQLETTDQQIPGGPGIPVNAITQPSLFMNKKGKPIDQLPPSQAAAAQAFITNSYPKPKTLEEGMRLVNSLQQSDPLFGTGARSSNAYSTKMVEKYDDQDYGFIPGMDLDDFYGKRESWYDTFGKLALRLPVYTATKVLEGFGFLGGLLSPWNWGTEEGIISKAADNTLYQAMSQFDDWTKNEWMPTFQEAADREKGFFSRLATDGDFWAEDVVDGVAFMASAFVPGAILSKIGVGAKAAAGLSALRIGVAEAEVAVQGAGAMANYFTKAQKIGQGIDKFNMWALATTTESMFEAKEVRDNVRNGLRLDEFGFTRLKDDGTAYTDSEINKISGEAARNTFAMNALLLGGTNAFQMKYFLKPFGLADDAGKIGLRTGAGLADEAVLKPAESAFKYYGKIAGGGILREGFIEENMQLAIQRVNEKYGIKGSVLSLGDTNLYKDLLNQYANQTVSAVSGKDKEAALNIGLGGLIGGGSNVLLSIGQRASDLKASQAGLADFSDAQKNWLKFGNIYKTQEVTTQDENGNPVVKNQIVFDKEGKPVVDEVKLNAAVTGISKASEMLTEAENTRNKFQRNFLRVSAFSEFVQAHINAGEEGSLMKKLDSLNEASAEDLAKLGFAVGENLNEDIQTHKSIASSIIKQNKVLNESILFDNSKEDKARKSYLTSIAAKQVVSKYLANLIQKDLDESKNELITSDMTSLSDSLVDQLNEMKYRIESQKQIVEYIKENGKESEVPLSLYEDVLKELENSFKKIEENNPESLKNLQKDKDGFYLYEKDERTIAGAMLGLNTISRQKGQVLNEVRNIGAMWAYYADNKNGKKNYVANLRSIEENLNEQAKKAEEEKARKEKEEADKAAGITQTEATPSTEQVPQQTEDQESEEQEDDPGLPSFLLEAFDIIQNNDPEFEDDFNTWSKSLGANYFIQQYNKKYNKSEPLNGAPKTEAQPTSAQQKDLVDGLSIADTTLATLRKAMAAVREVYSKIADNEDLVKKLIDKINQVKDAFAKSTLLSVITGTSSEQPSEQASTYIPINDVNPSVLTVKANNHIGYDKVSMNQDEVETGFVLVGNKALIESMGSNTATINDNVKVVATRKFVNENQEKLKQLGIPNRTIITYETPDEINKKLKLGVSVIAAAARYNGFGTQIFLKNNEAAGNVYIAGIENYAIVHPDNTTEPITFSEEQREFVKANMLVNGQQMTDQQYDRFQKLYTKIQDFNEEVELVLGENEQIDITPIFNKYFTVTKSGKDAVKGQSFESLVQNNPDKLFRITYQTESGEILEKDVPLVARSWGSGWILDFPLNSGETLMYTDDSGEVVPVTDTKEYAATVHGITPEFTDKFGAKYAWVAKEPTDPKGFKPYALKRDTGTSPVEHFKKFAKDFAELKAVLTEGEKTKEYKYKGQTFSTVNQLMSFFNSKVYGFYQSQNWFVNLSYNPKTKKFAFELRPSDKEVRNSLTGPQKQALNLYFSDASITSVTDNTQDADVLEAYKKWMNSLMSDYKKLTDKLENSDDNLLKQFRSELKTNTLFEYENENDVKEYMLKLVDKDGNTAKAPVQFLKYNARETKKKVTVALNDEPVLPVKRKATTRPKKSKAEGFSVLGTLGDNDVAGQQLIPTQETATPTQEKNKPVSAEPAKKTGRKIVKKLDDEAPFMLRSEEEYKSYTDKSFNEEVQWLSQALRNSGISLRDLGTIIDNLSAGKQVLGYYKNRAVYVNKNLSSEGTIYHEAFHGLFRDIFTSDQRAFYLSKAKARMGTVTQQQISDFRNERRYFNKTDREIIDLIAEEYLADGFRKYKLDKKEPIDSWFKRFVKLIERIINFFNSNQRAIDRLYKDFDGGVYAEQVVNPENSISNEGVFALAYGRPKLVETIDEETNEPAFGVISKVPLNLEVQNELVSKLTYRVANMTTGNFASKFVQAVEELKAEYDLEALIATGNPELADAIRNKYQNKFAEASFVLGVPVKYVLDDQLLNDEEANELLTEPGDNTEALETIKGLVKEKIDTLGLEKTLADSNLQLPEDEEDAEQTNKGGEFDKVHINPLEGLSREFRNLFGIIPYQYTDPDLGVTVSRTADGSMLFNAMIKVASDNTIDQILPSLAKAVEMMEEDNDPKYAPLKAFADFIQRQFGIADLSDSTSKPTRNLYLYKQFIDTFFVTELPSYVIKSTTTKTSTKSEVFDASINQDVNQKREAIKFYYDQEYRKLKTPEQIEAFNKKFKDLQNYINQNLFTLFLAGNGINQRKALNQVVDKVKQLMDDVNIVLPKSLIRQSLLAIYNIEEKKPFNVRSTRNIQDIEVNQTLMKEGAYLQSDFFKNLAQIAAPNYPNLFADKDANVNLGKDYTKIDAINKILKKAAKFIIKYDINSAMSVYQNAEYENIYRYTRHTPPSLLVQKIREEGISSLQDMYPMLRDWYTDNPLFNGSEENNLFLNNLYLSSFGGFRQEIGDTNRKGVTFGSIDPKTFLLSGIVHFANRERISEGKVSINTFRRSRTQEEATTTNFLLTAKYKRYADGLEANSEYIKDIMSLLRQEYNRIQREWANRNDENAVRYNGYNNLNGDVNKLRAYQFKHFEHFFDQQETTDENSVLRQEMKDALVNAAKSGVTFEQALKSDVLMQLPNQLSDYTQETFEALKKNLEKYELLKYMKKDGETIATSDLLPTKINQDFKDGTLEENGYDTLDEMLLDYHLNVEMNKRTVNQIFDGDLATGIKTAQEFYKRNKSGVISGNSAKVGYFRTAVVENLQSFIPTSTNPLTGKTDFDLNQLAQDEETPNSKGVDIADGQSYHIMNHRIRLMDNWGRLSPAVKSILHKAKYKTLDKEDIDFLNENKVVLNTLKTATGGILEYYKLSEHLLIRPDVSRLVIPQGMNQEEAEQKLDELYSEIEMLEDQIIEDPFSAEAADLESKVEELYSEVHGFWSPKRGREKLHYLLNSMEASGIDHLFDTNASKKTTVVPIKLNTDTVTNLKPSKSSSSSLFKFMQVETSGIHDKITLPSQARQLLTTYINKLANDQVYRNKSLKDLAKEYSDTLGDISKSSMNNLNKAILDEKGELNISQLFTTMYNGLKKQGIDSNTLKYFEVRDGKPVHNPNIPAIKKIFTYYYFSMFNNAVFSQKVSGRSDILVSEFGYEVLYDTQDNNRIITQEEQEQNPELYNDTDRFKTRHLGISVEEVNGKKVYTVEVMIPKKLFDNESERELFLTKLSTFFSTRIPTEDKRSMVVAKAVDYIDPAYQNSIVVPQLVHILAGSDLDVDKLYSHTFDYYIDYNEVAHVYGDYSKYTTPSQGQFAEYIQYMSSHPYFKELVDIEMEKMVVKPVLTSDFKKVTKELGISTLELTPEEIKLKRDDIISNLDLLENVRKDLQNQHDIAFNEYVSSSKKDRSSKRDTFIKKRAEYLIARDAKDAAKEELRETKKELRKVNNTLKIAALVNILKSKGMPVTQAEFSKYLKTNPSPVIPVLNNTSLQQKIDILSNEKVFKDFYINERSTVEPFRNIAASIGASVDSVITQNSIFSVMGDVVANDLNATNKDGIGIAASFNKFIAFAEKNDLVLSQPLIRVLDENNKKIDYVDFTNTSAIRRTGETLGMFADAAKEPIPSVLNLNPDTAGISNVIVGMSGNLQLGLLINKIPFIEEIIQDYRTTKSAAQDTSINLEGSISSRMKNYFKQTVGSLQQSGRLGELLVAKEKNGKVIGYGEVRPMYIKTIEPNPEVAKMEPENIRLGDLGIELLYEDNSVVAEDVAKAYLASTYASIIQLNSDILLLGKVLNLIKQQEPDFNKLDEILSAYNYFLSGTSLFGESIVKALTSSKEYSSLIQAASMMSSYSRQLLIERTPLFKSVVDILNLGLNNTFGDEKAKQDIIDQVGKFIIINKMKTEMKSQIDDLSTKDDAASKAKLEMLEDSYKYFSADFWLDNNTLLDDLDYLNSVNPGNPFVDFLKVNVRQDINYLEATSRMRLDKDLTENIINGYESLQKSKDPRTLKLSRQLFYYLLTKDGLGYGAFTFLKYINPDIPQMSEVSRVLDQFQKLLFDQQAFIFEKEQEIRSIMKSGVKENEKEAYVKKIVDEILNNYNKLFDNFFNNKTKAGKIDWINGIVNKIFSYAGNQKYIRTSYGINIESADNKNLMQDILNAGVFSHMTNVKKLSGKKFQYTNGSIDKFTVDLNPIKKAVPGQDPYKIDELLYREFAITRDLATMEINGAKFKVLLSDNDGNLFRLVSVDDVPVSDRIAQHSVDKLMGPVNTGLKAEYVRMDVEGTKNLLSFGFNQQDGKKLWEAVRPKSEQEEEVRYFLNGQVVSPLSDNMTKQEAPSKYMGDIVGPVDLGIEGIVSDDDIEGMIARGELKGAKVASKATAQAPDEIGFKKIGQPATETTDTKKGTEITYTPKGKQVQTYTVAGNQIFNKDGQEVFKEDSVVRNKIYANLAVKTGNAVIVNHKGASYIVNKKNQVMSVKTGKIMQWDINNGDMKAILAEAAKKFTPVGADITIKEIDELYNSKSTKNVTLEQYREEAKEYINTMTQAGMSKSAILEQLKCL